MEKCVILLVLACFLLGLSAGAPQVPDFCQLFPSDGPGPHCLAYLPQFFFNSTSQDCEEFIYGGCGGNNNRFSSKKKCMDTCNPRPAVLREMAMPQTIAIGGCVSPRSHRKENACNQPRDSGPCMGYFPQFFYNATSRECEIFIYGGCRGNQNKFDSLTSCQMNCRAAPVLNATEVCSLPPVTGPCKASFQQLYYNPQSHRCEPFIYGGCGGNDNRFDSIKDCMRTCHSEGSDVITPLIPKTFNQARGQSSDCTLEPETGPCRAHIPSFFYNATSHKCEKFIYGGCGGNDNRFVSRRECNLMCRQKPEQPTEAPGPDPTDTCHLPPKSGPCDAFIPRHYYNHKTKKCQEFVYGGCKGNQNNFVDEDACVKACQKD